MRVQSMTSTPTSDTGATVDQIVRIASAGAEIVRMTVQNIREAENLTNIKSALNKAGCFIPLVADVHFNPLIAETAASIVEKVRINPGNYGISPRRSPADLPDEVYGQELTKAKTAFSRLLAICREHGTALRIGVNHGSLSPRIINRYGNTPEGMVNSALEFLRFCIEEDFHNVVVSLKSSNILIMVEANRMMADHMYNEAMEYPIHLGVTEAGEGEDGRIRSAAGIGTLLFEGIGETIRVSLTEDPEKEIPVAKKLLDHVEELKKENTITSIGEDVDKTALQDHQDNTEAGKEPAWVAGDFYKEPFSRRISIKTGNIGGEQSPVVLETLTDGQGVSPAGGGVPVADYVFDGGRLVMNLPAGENQSDPDSYPLLSVREYLAGSATGQSLVFLRASLSDLSGKLIEKAASDKRLVFVAVSQTSCPPREMKSFVAMLDKKKCTSPVIFKKEYDKKDIEDYQISAAADFAPLFIDKIGDGLWITSKAEKTERISVSTAFSILQSSRIRTTKTEFISCPSCGRTMFNIQEATAAVKRETSHLRGLKIAVMGCIVNGPGEMADADYGYVGSGKGKVSLYKKQTLVKRNVPEEDAVNELIGLIKEGGDWRVEG